MNNNWSNEWGRNGPEWMEMSRNDTRNDHRGQTIK